MSKDRNSWSYHLLKNGFCSYFEEADAQAREYIAGNYGENYIAGENDEKNGAKIQDAHEAIRPSDINRTPVMVKESLSRDQFRLYQLIWKRFTASRMAQAVYETTNVKIGAGEYRFTVSASKIAFDGFMSVYTSDDDEKAENNVLVGSIDENTVLNLKEFDEKQHFTQPWHIIQSISGKNIGGTGNWTS